VADLRALQQWMLTAIITGDSTEHVTGRLDIYSRSYKIRTLRRAITTLEKAKLL
jgi:hypothetical protein